MQKSNTGSEIYDPLSSLIRPETNSFSDNDWTMTFLRESTRICISVVLQMINLKDKCKKICGKKFWEHRHCTWHFGVPETNLSSKGQIQLCCIAKCQGQLNGDGKWKGKKMIFYPIQENELWRSPFVLLTLSGKSSIEVQKIFPTGSYFSDWFRDSSSTIV